MPKIAKFKLPDGRIARFKVPDQSGTSLAGEASRLAVKGIELPFSNPISSKLEQAGETVNTVVQGSLDKSVEGADPLDPSMTGVLKTVLGMGKLTPSNLALNVGGEAVGRMALPFAANAAGKGVADAEGVLTGAGDAVGTAFKAGREGGAAQDALIGTMRGNVSEQEAVKTVMDSLKNIKQARGNEYVKQMEKIQAKSFQKNIDLKPIKTKLDDLLNDYNIVRKKNGKIDFSRAALDDTSINDVKRMADYVDGWGKKAGDNTVKGLDILKRKIDDFYSPSGEARAFVSSLRNKVKSTIVDAVPEYADMTKKYEQASETIKDISKELSLGPNSNAGTVMRKLKQTLRQNFDLRKDFVTELDKAGKGHILEQIAGSELSPMMPKGIMRAVAGGDILAGVGTHNPAMLAGLPLTSPRLAGEAALKLGQASRLASPIGDVANKLPLSSMALRGLIPYLQDETQ